MNLSLFKKSLSGIKSNAIYSIFINITQLLVTITVARMLEDKDVAIIGVVVPLIAALYIFCELGMSSAIIQSQSENINKQASSLLFVALMLSVIISCFLIMLRVTIAQFFGIPELEIALYVLAGIVVVKTYGSIVSALAIKAMKFGGEIKTRFLGTLLGALVSIFGVLTTGSYIYVLIGYLVTPIASLLLLNLTVCETRVFPRYSRKEFLEVSKYSGNMFISNLLYFFSKSGIGLIAAKAYPQALFGHYYLANQVATYPRTAFNSICNNVIFSALSKSQDCHSDIKNQSLEIGYFIVLITSPLTIFAFCYSSEIFNLVFGSDWDLASELFKFFCVFIWLSMIGGVPAISLQAIGLAEELMYSNLLRVPLVTLSIVGVLFTELGIVEFVAAILFAEVGPICFLIYRYMRTLKVSFMEIYISYLKTTILYLSSLLLATILIQKSNIENDVLIMFINFFISIGFYVMLLSIFDRKRIIRGLRMVKCER